MQAIELKSEADASEGTSEHRRVKLKRASGIQYHGQLGVVSESHLVKCSRSDKKNKRQKKQKKNVSRLQTGADVSEADIVGGSNSHPVKRKKMKKQHRLQTCADASEADVAGGSRSHPVKRKRMQSHGRLGVCSESHLVNCKRIKKKRVSRETGGTDATEASEHEKVLEALGVCRLPSVIGASRGSSRGLYNRTHVTCPRFVALVMKGRVEMCKTALELYGKSHPDAEFEILEVVDKSSSRLRFPGSESSTLWIHISFIAKPKNAESGDCSPKHFFGELYRDSRSLKFHATYCSTFEPSDDPGFDHGCIFCVPGQKFHPADGYLVGRPPWKIQKYRLV